MEPKPYDARFVREQRGAACYLVRWSPFFLMDPLLIRRIIPSDGGVFQVFERRNRQLEMIMMDRAFYGGLRNRVRELADPLYMGRNPYRKEIQEGECYVRYALTRSQEEMDDLLHYFTGRASSGRYADVMVEEREIFQIRKEA